MARPVNIKLIMDVYKKLRDGKCHKTTAEKLKISESHVGRIAHFLVEEYFLVPQSLKSQTRFYVKTERVPTLKILCDVINFRRNHDGGSSVCGIHKLQYRSELEGKVTQRVIDRCRLITPKGTKKYLFPRSKKLKHGFNIIIHDGKNKKSVMFYLNRIHLTLIELPVSDDIIKERIRRIAYNVQHYFKIKLGLPQPVGKSFEYAFVPKEKFLVDALEDATFEIDSPVGKVKADKSGDSEVLDRKEIEFNNKDLAKTYLKMIPTVHMIGQLVLDNNDRIEHLEEEFVDIKSMLSETKPMLEMIVKYIDDEQKLKELREKENRERGVI